MASFPSMPPVAGGMEPVSITPLPSGLPARLDVLVTLGGETFSLELDRRVLRAPGFRLLLLGEGGRAESVPPPPARTYRGRVRDVAGSLVCATRLEAGICATVLLPGGGGFKVWPPAALGVWDRGPLEAAAGVTGLDLFGLGATHIATRFEDAHPFLCGVRGEGLDDNEGVDDAGGVDGGATPPLSDFGTLEGGGADRGGDGGESAGGGGGPEVCDVTLAEIAYDSDYEFYHSVCEDDPDTCMALIEDGLNVTDAIYVRDTRITYSLTGVVLHTDAVTDFYAQFPDASDFGAMLGAFRSEWNANHSEIQRDMAYLMTGKPRPNYAGLAFVSVVCSSSAYGMGIGQWGYENILRHELGHNWSCGHDCGDGRRYIMCGNSIPAFSGYNIRQIEDHRDSRSCLSATTVSVAPAPPYCRTEALTLTQGVPGAAIEVLRNETDPNCDRLRVTSHEVLSACGARVDLIASETPGSYGTLLYLPRANLVGSDRVGYTVADEDGNEVQGFVSIDFVPRSLVAYYRMDEMTGTTVNDSSGNGHHGRLDSALDWTTGRAVPGHSGGALAFPGVAGQEVQVSHASRLEVRDAITVAAWFRVDAFSGDGETLVAKGSSSWRLKRDGARSQLKFTCTGVSGVEVHGARPVDDGLWHHAVGVYDGRSLGLYLDGALDASVDASGRIDLSTSDLEVGGNEFQGAIDEVRVYNFALSPAEIVALQDHGRVDNPLPTPGVARVLPSTTLSWVPLAGVLRHEVYLGSTASAVEGATAASPEFKESSATSAYAPRLEPDTAYFWRVDSVTPEGKVRGDVWGFSTSFAYSAFDEPALDASSYTPGPGGKELGFSTTTQATGGQSPLAGVVTTTSTPTSPIFTHRSLAATTRFGSVDLSEREEVVVALDLQARDTGYEEEDSLEVFVESGAQRRTLVRHGCPGSIDQIAGGGYQTYAAVLPAEWAEASLVVSSSSNSSQGSERFDFDSVSFSCATLARPLASSRFREAAPGARAYLPGAGAIELGFQSAQTGQAGASPLLGVEAATSPLASGLLVHRSVDATTTFDPIDLSGLSATGRARLSAAVRIWDTGYEANDRLELLATNGAATVPLLSVTGTSGLANLAGRGFLVFAAELPREWREARLVFKSSSDSSQGSERYDLAAVEVVELLASGCSVGEPPAGPAFRRGDTNGDRRLDLSDGVRILGYLFLGASPLECLDAGDADDNGVLELTDGVRILGHLFLGGAPPPAPGPTVCGEDPTLDALGCAAFPSCP